VARQLSQLSRVAVADDHQGRHHQHHPPACKGMIVMMTDMAITIIVIYFKVRI